MSFQDVEPKWGDNAFPIQVLYVTFSTRHLVIKGNSEEKHGLHVNAADARRLNMYG